MEKLDETGKGQPTAGGLRLVGLVCTLVVVFAAGMVPIHAADYFTHLAMGRYIVEHGVPRAEPFLFPCQGRPLIAFEWLAEVLCYGGYRIWAHGGMQLAKAAVAVGIFCLVFLTGRRRGAPLAIAAAVTVWAVLAGQHRLMARPHLLSWLIVVAVFWLLHAGWSLRRTMAALLVAAVLLANLHGSAVICAGLVGLFGLSCVVTPGGHGQRADLTRRRGWWLMAGAVMMIAASAINPRGLALLTYPFRPVDAADVRSVVQEWRAMPPLMLDRWPPALMADWPALLADRWPFWLLAAAVVGGPVACLAICRRRLTLLEVVLPVGMVILAVWMRRFGLLAAVLCGPILAGQLSELIARIGRKVRITFRLGRAFGGGLWAFWMVAAVAMLTMGSEVRRPGWGLEGELFPVKAVDWMVERDELRGPTFANYEWGGYVHWRLYPLGCQAFIDGRNWDYPRQLFADYGRIMRRADGWLDKLDEYGAVIRLERWRPQTVGPAVERYDNPGWAMVYWDDNDVVLVRDVPSFAGFIASFACGETFPPVVLQRMHLVSKGAVGRAESRRLRRRLEAKIEQDDQSLMARVGLGQVLAELGEYDLAAAALERVVDGDATIHDAWIRLCWVHLLAGRPERAVAAAERYFRQAKGAEVRRKALRLVVNSAQGAGDVKTMREGLVRYLRLGGPDEWSAGMEGRLGGL